jgi:acetyl-CoA acyltransferase 1
MDRVARISSEVKAPNKEGGFGKIGVKAPTDVVVVSALRTPFTKSNRGDLKDTAPEVLLATVVAAVVKDSKIDPNLIEDMQVGNVNQPAAGALTSRIAQLLAELPIKVPVAAVNRQCSSGLEACAIIAAKIKTGIIECGLGCGVESMTLFSMNDIVDPAKLSDASFDHPIASNCLLNMGETSEIMAERYKITRKDVDTYAAESFRRAVEAQKNGLFDAEITPVKTTIKDKDGKVTQVTVTKDDGIRPTPIETLSKLKPSFRGDGISHAGNSSQVVDGAAAVLLMTRRMANKLGLKIMGKFISHSVIGVPPDVMGIGPTVAIPMALSQAGINVNDVDIFELNEAFASVAVLAIRELKLDAKKVNPKGGAIAFGHPLGTTGARQVATLLNELKRTGKKVGVISMCIGTGMGAAAVLEAE